MKRKIVFISFPLQYFWLLLSFSQVSLTVFYLNNKNPKQFNYNCLKTMNLFYNFVITYCLNESKVKYQPLTLSFVACRGGKSIEIVILAFLQSPQMSREYIFGCRTVESPSLAAPRWPLRLQQSAYSFFGFFPLTNIWKRKERCYHRHRSNYGAERWTF